jgi:type I restriction enzyme S subunit
MKNELKSSPIGLLPNDWRIGMLGEYLDYIQPTKYITKSFNEIGNTPVLTANKAFILGYTDETEGVYNNVPVIIFDDFTTDSKFIDFPFKVRSSALKILAFTTKEIDINYLYESLKRIKYQSTEHKRYWISEYQYLKIPIPPVPEQQKIAEILSTVDAKIEIIDQQISETQDLKKGLMQQLLTKGIGHTEFKDSALGEIPKSWEVEGLGTLLKSIKGGGTPSKDVPEYWRKEIPWVTVKDLKKLILDDAIDCISEDGLDNSAANLIPAWTLIISTRMAVGKAVFVTIDVAINQDLKALFPKDNLSKYFLFHWFFANSDDILKLASGSTVKGIRLEVLKGLKIALPSIEEQRQISEILTSVDDKLEVLSEKKTTYQEMKQGLMQQLLTGKVRV